MAIQHANSSSSLADILERVLDKGIVIAGDIKISLADVELLNIKIRLLVASVDKAREMGIDWWQHDPYLSSQAQESKPIAALKGTNEHDVFAKSSKQQAINISSDLTPKENLELKTEANIAEKQVKASYERKIYEPIIIDAIPVNDRPISSDKININGSSWDYTTSEILESGLRDGKTSSLGKPSVGRSIEKIPKK